MDTTGGRVYQKQNRKRLKPTAIKQQPPPSSAPQLLLSRVWSPARQKPRAWQLNYSQFAQEGSEYSTSQQVPFLKMTKVIYISSCMLQKLSLPCRGKIKCTLCTPGTGIAFAQWYQSSERPYGFLYPPSYICPLMTKCASLMFQGCSSGHH